MSEVKTMTDKFKLIKKAYEQLINIGGYDYDKFCKIIKPVAEAYGAAEFKAELTGNKFYKEPIIFYSIPKEDFGEQIIKYSGRTGDERMAEFSWTNRKGAVWNEEEIEDIRFLNNLAYNLSGKIRLSKLAGEFYFFDTETRMPNLKKLEKFVSQLTVQRKISDYEAVFLNIIGCNYITKKVGYKTGVGILSQYGHKLMGLLDDNEMAARLGGDNFIVFFKKSNEKKILDFLAGTNISVDFASSSINFHIRARAGIYRIQQSDEPFGPIMNKISATVNYAKSISRTPVVFYSEEIEKQVIKHKEYSQKFKSALDNGEFFVMYQPKVYTDNNSIYGGEALVRWINDGKIIPPGDFIEILEKEHLICQLDFYVLEQTCKNIRRWIYSGAKPVKISVNFSNEHLYSENLVERIAEVVDRYGIDHKLIEIEMTETVDAEATKKLLGYVKGLHKNNFTVAIDDFGIGYSSLHLLQSVCVDVLKIDKSFVSEVAEDEGKRENVILKHIINMAADIGLEIVAEGVETDIQRDRLKEMNCHRIQGYVYDKPLDEKDFYQRITSVHYSN